MTKIQRYESFYMNYFTYFCDGKQEQNECEYNTENENAEFRRLKFAEWKEQSGARENYERETSRRCWIRLFS